MTWRLKRSNCTKCFFLKKQLKKISCTYWLLSFCKIFKKFLGAIQSYENVPFLGPQLAHLSCTKFFWYKPLLLLSSTYWPFLWCKILKILTADPELWGCTIFEPKMVHLPQTIFFFWKIINIILIYLLAPFIGQNF